MTRKIKFKRPNILSSTTFCPGCGHGVIHRIIAQTLEEFEVANRTVMIVGVGCSATSYKIFSGIESVNVPHGRAAAVATGAKTKDNIVFTYQGDGDAAAIGLIETIWAANRGVNITVIFVNNAVYGMTGGQMAPTTLIGQSTTTGTRSEEDGYPIQMCEILVKLKAPAYIARVSVDPQCVRQAERAIKKAFQYQIEGKGYSFVEVLSGCPSNWKMQKPKEVVDYVQKMKEVFPLGAFRDKYVEGDTK